jgi:hypothetical protein
MLSLSSPYPFFTDKDGDPLDAGYIYVGEVALNPETSPVTVYWDQAQTQPAAQPLRTLNGYIVRNGTPARAYVDGDDFAITVKDKRGIVLFYERSVSAASGLREDLASTTDAGLGAAMIGYNPAQPYSSGLGQFLNYVFGRTAGEIAAGVTPTNYNYFPGDPRRFGAKCDGVTNDTDAYVKTIRSSLKLFIPPGVSNLLPTTTDAILYLGMSGPAANPSSRDGMTVFGEGKNSVIRLGDNAGRSALLFGGGNSDVLKNMTFRDFVIDLNGANNLQTSYADPLRYNNAFYLSSYCEDFTFQNLKIKNHSGAQTIRVGNDTSAGYGKNIRFLHCDFDNFGVGLAGNQSQDTSCLYIQADGILIQGCQFTGQVVSSFDYSKGFTAIEVHGDSSTIITENRFRYIKMPVLIASSAKPHTNVTISSNSFYQCGFLSALDEAGFDQRRITWEGNVYYSTIHNSSSVVRTGSPLDVPKTRDDILFSDNILFGLGNTNQRTHIFYVDGNYLRSLVIRGNSVSYFNGSLIYCAGEVMDTDYLDITIDDNILDSLGASGGVFPNNPCFIHFEVTSGNVNLVSINNNTFKNTSLKDYGPLGVTRLQGSIKYAYMRDSKGTLSSAYSLHTGTITGNIVMDLEQAFIGSAYKMPNWIITPGASVTPALNGEVTVQLTSNTQLTFKAKGSDGVVRSGSLTLA